MKYFLKPSFLMSQVKSGTGPTPVSKLATIAIRMRYVSFTGPPTHRSLASRIAQDHGSEPTGIGQTEQHSRKERFNLSPQLSRSNLCSIP
jgi:hypothetical protein